MKLEIYHNSSNIDNKSDPDLLLSKDNLFIYNQEDCKMIKDLKDNTFILIGKILGIYDGIDLHKINNALTKILKKEKKL